MFLSRLLAGLLLGSAVAADDYLVSHRHQKRGLDGSGNYNISIYHINDVHAHLDEFSSSGTDCTAPAKGCYGGYARVKSVIDHTRPTHSDSLFLNLGDESQGTLFFSFYGGEKIAATLNQLGFDAMTLGNHEFDRGDDFVGDFVKNLTYPVVCANIQTNHSAINSSVIPYHIFKKHDLAVIGVTTDTIPSISNPGPGTTFQDPISVVQATVDHIKATENITRIIAMTHIGYDKDIELAQKTKGVYLIVGGHSHTLLGSMDGAEGPYPTIEKNIDGDDVFIVTSYRWGEYLGYIDVAYDPAGKIVAYTGGPVHLTNTTAQDAGLQAQIKAWRGPFEAFAAEVVGSSTTELDQTRCKRGECLLGDYMADAMMDYRNGAADAALINGGGVRATIDAGEITRGEVITAFPFGNAVVELKFTGDELWKIFEGIVSEHSLFNDKPVIPLMQVSKELRIQYNPTLANGSRLISLDVAGAPVNRSREYTVATIDFLAGGGDNFMPEVPAAEIVVLDALDEVLLRYINKTSPVNATLDGRIAIMNLTTPTNGSSGGAGSGGSSGAAPTSFSGALVWAAAAGAAAALLL